MGFLFILSVPKFLIITSMYSCISQSWMPCDDLRVMLTLRYLLDMAMWIFDRCFKLYIFQNKLIIPFIIFLLTQKHTDEDTHTDSNVHVLFSFEAPVLWRAQLILGYTGFRLATSEPCFLFSSFICIHPDDSAVSETAISKCICHFLYHALHCYKLGYYSRLIDNITSAYLVPYCYKWLFWNTSQNSSAFFLENPPKKVYP